jgi:hypothetical protein
MTSCFAVLTDLSTIASVAAMPLASDPTAQLGDERIAPVARRNYHPAAVHQMRQAIDSRQSTTSAALLANPGVSMPSSKHPFMPLQPASPIGPALIDTRCSR